ncbi:hypothetical protein TWF694_007404 [Orbilia ellipsospora]|uniref:Uncharacterized protein n=1 Tax=Orbilia ellipsospora TaxID=2528407 RepID=A0AAV9XKA0_9PEZI
MKGKTEVTFIEVLLLLLLFCLHAASGIPFDVKQETGNPQSLDSTFPSLSSTTVSLEKITRDNPSDSISKRVLGPEIFYFRERMYVVCGPPSEVYSAELPIGSGYERVPIDEVHIWPVEFPSRQAAEHYIEKRQTGCTKCRCRKNGVMIPAPNAHQILVPVIGEHLVNEYKDSCPDDDAVNTCINVYHCYCFATLNAGYHNRKATKATNQEIIDALNQISPLVKLANPNWGYRRSKSSSVALRWDPDFLGPVSNNHRRLAPGTKEPYYLEGPGLGGIANWAWLQKLQGLKGIGGLELKKRESDGATDIDKTCSTDGDAQDGHKDICAVEGERKNDGNNL